MKSRSLVVFPVVALAGGFAAAQGTSPDAGSLRQQIEQPRRDRLPQATPQPVPAPKAPSVAPGPGVTVTVRAFRFVGNTLLGSEMLSQALSAYLNRPLDFADLTRVTEVVSEIYRASGWVVRTLLPEQEIDDGVVTLQVVEARFGGVQVEGAASAPRVPLREVQAHILHQQPQGQPLSAQALDRALLIADDLPGVAVAGSLASGPGEGETSLVLQVTNEPLLQGEVGMDNLGSRATGSVRKTASLNANSPTGHGELVSLNLLHTQGSAYARIALTAPVGYSGLRVGVNASAMNYTVIAGPSASTGTPITGKSGSLGLEWSAPLVRERMANLYFAGGLDSKTFLNRDTQVRADYATDSLRLGLSGNRFDSLGGGGASNAFVQMLWGRLGDIAAHPQGSRLEGDYRKLTYAFSRQQSISAAHSVSVSWSGQHATQLLDSSEKFYVGGASSVRAYPASEVSGERGQLWSAEWRWRLSSELVAAAFFDQGRAVALSATAGEAASAYRLTGRGLSLAWQGPKGLNARLTWAHRNGENPKPTASGTDGDGTLRRDRIWVTAALPF